MERYGFNLINTAMLLAACPSGTPTKFDPTNVVFHMLFDGSDAIAEVELTNEQFENLAYDLGAIENETPADERGEADVEHD